jgi:hypothetical protein
MSAGSARRARRCPCSSRPTDPRDTPWTSRTSCRGHNPRIALQRWFGMHAAFGDPHGRTGEPVLGLEAGPGRCLDRPRRSPPLRGGRTLVGEGPRESCTGLRCGCFSRLWTNRPLLTRAPSPAVVGSVLSGGRGPASAGSAGRSSRAVRAGRDLPHPPPPLRPDDGGLGECEGGRGGRGGR